MKENLKLYIKEQKEQKEQNELKEEITQLERDLKDHEGYLKRGWLSPEGYKKWYARKRSLLSKIKLRKQKCGILMTDPEFDKYILTIDKETYFQPIPDESIRNRLTIRQTNILYDIAANNHMR